MSPNRRGIDSSPRLACAALPVIAAVAAVLLAGGWMWLRDSSLVRVRNVQVTGVHGAGSGAVRSALTAAAQDMTTLNVDVGALRSVHPNVKEHAGRKPFKDIKVMKDDAAGVEKNAADIRARYSKIFGV